MDDNKNKHDVTDFDSQVIERSRTVPVLCDFWAPWCRPCVLFAPLLEKAAQEAGGRWELAKLNVEDHPEIAERFGISGIPALKLFHRGEVKAETTGAMSERGLREWLDENLPDEHVEKWEAVEEALGGLRFAEAERLIENSGLPAGARRDFLLAKAVLWRDPAHARGLAGAKPAEGLDPVQWQALNTLADLLEEEAPSGADSGLDRSFESSRNLLREGRLEEAMKILEEILLEKPQFREGRAVRLQRAIIQYLGIRHALGKLHYAACSGAASLL